MLSLFYVSLGVLCYTFFGYPLLVGVVGYLFPKKVKKKPIFPQVSLLLSVYNEELRVKEKLENLLSLHYPEERLEILIGSDGSTDQTNKILRSFNCLSGKKGLKFPIRVFYFPERRGKPAVLNELVKEAKGEILFFADCRQRWNETALERITENFADPKVGVVSGLVKEGEEGYYRKYENFIRLSEARFSSTPGAYGPIYAIRRSLFSPLPVDTILDDFVLPMEAVKQGYRSLLEVEAVADDLAFPLIQERVRKIRTLAGNFQVFLRYRWLLNPFVNPIWFQTFSHKFLRLIAPLFLLLLFFSNLFLWEKGGFYRTLFLLQVVFLLIALASLRWKESRICRLAATFLELNWCTVVGFWHFCTKKQKVTWEKVKG